MDSNSGSEFSDDSPVRAPLTPPRPGSKCSMVSKSPWWSNLSPLDPRVALVHSPSTPAVQQNLGAGHSPQVRSPVYHRVRLSSPPMSTVKRSGEWLNNRSYLELAAYSEDHHHPQASFGDMSTSGELHDRARNDQIKNNASESASCSQVGDQMLAVDHSRDTPFPELQPQRPRAQHKLDFAHDCGGYTRSKKSAPIQQSGFQSESALKDTTAGFDSEVALPPQHPLSFSPPRESPMSRTRRKPTRLRAPRQISATEDDYDDGEPSSPHSSHSPCDRSPSSSFEMTSSPPPFDPSVPRVSLTVEAEAPGPLNPSFSSFSTGGDPAGNDSNVPPTTPRQWTRSIRSSGGRPRAPDVAPGSLPFADPNAPEGFKPCNCKKSKCLKLYCECFARQAYCQGCNCVNCHNVAKFKDARQKAIVGTLERDPNAFFRGSTQGTVVNTSNQKHRKGCHCKKSECLKKYCECFQAGVPCTDICKCVECRNGKCSSGGDKKKGKLKRKIIPDQENKLQVQRRPAVKRVQTDSPAEPEPEYSDGLEVSRMVFTNNIGTSDLYRDE